MAEIVNLRIARKRRTRAAEEKAAEENRIRFGRTKAQRSAEDAMRQRERGTLDAHRRETPDHDGEESGGA